MPGIIDAGNRMLSTRRVLKKFAESGCSSQDWPDRDNYENGKKQRLDGKFQASFTGEIASGQFAK
jgi:hypothetical protein